LEHNPPLQAEIRKYPHSVISLNAKCTTGLVCPLQVNGVCRKFAIFISRSKRTSPFRFVCRRLERIDSVSISWSSQSSNVLPTHTRVRKYINSRLLAICNFGSFVYSLEQVWSLAGDLLKFVYIKARLLTVLRGVLSTAHLRRSETYLRSDV
jgi:hypothetical protein